MTKKHFDKIAKDINERALVIFHSEESSYTEKWYGLTTLYHLINDLCSNFSQFNKNFSAYTFIVACGVNKLKLELEREQATRIATGI